MINISFPAINRLLALSLEDDVHRLRQTDYVLPKVELEDYNFITDRKHFLDQTIEDDTKNKRKY